MEPNTPIFENESQLEKYSKLSKAIHTAFQKKHIGNQIKTAGAFVGSYLGIMGSAVGIAATGSAMAGSLAFVAAPVAVVAAYTAILNHYQSKKAKLNEREFMEHKNAESAVKEGVPYNPLPVEKGLSMKQRMTQAFSQLGRKIKTEYADIFSESAIRVSEESALNAQQKPTVMERFSTIGNRIIKNSETAIAKLSDSVYNGIEFTDKKLNHMASTITNKLDKVLNEDLPNAIDSVTKKANKINDKIYRGLEDSIEFVGGKVESFAQAAGHILKNAGANIVKLDEKLNEGLYHVIQSTNNHIAKIDDKIYHGFENSIDFVGGKVEAFSETAGRILKNTGMTIVKLDEKLNEGLYNAIQSVHHQVNKMGEVVAHTGDKINHRVYEAIQGVNGKIDRFAQAGSRIIENSGAAITRLDNKLNEGLYNVIQSTGRRINDIGDSIVKLDDKLNESLYNSIQSVNHKIDRFTEFGGRIIKNSSAAITRLDNKLNEGLYNAAQSVDGKISLVSAALKQMRSNSKLSSMSAGRSSVEDAKNIEKMASAMADLRNAFGVAGETGGKMTAFGAKKLEESVASDIERVVVGLRRNGDHKAIFNDLSNHLDAISGYGYNLAEKGGLSHPETADRIKTVIDCAVALGADPETMRHAYHQAEDKISENVSHEEKKESSSRIAM